MIFPLLMMGGGALALITMFAIAGNERDVPVHEPDAPVVPGSTGYKLVDKILPELRKAADSSGIPLGLLIGWIARESGGRLGETTKLDERGYFQLMPSESKSLGLDHERLSTDSVYSINGGMLLIGKYMKDADALAVASRGSPYYWRLVKLGHTMGGGALKKIVEGAKKVGAASSWEALEKHALDNESTYLSMTKHSPSKWFPLVDKVYSVGAPFGFGDGTGALVVGEAPAFTDIPDPLALLPKYRRS